MNRKVSSFLDEFPILKEEWDYEKNNELGILPENLSKGNNKKVWWKCKSGNKCHIWEASISNRTYGVGCPFCSNKKMCPCGCNSVWKSNPELRDEWDEKKNGDMKSYAPASNKKVWWRCSIKSCHIWKSVICDRTHRGNGCPFCSNRKICLCGCNSLYESNPELRDEWDEKKNGDMKSYAPASNKKVWWRCSIKSCHIWKSVIYSRTCGCGCGCPFCCNQKICLCGCNSLYESNPELRDEWIDEKNGDMKSYAPASDKKVWWKCKEKNHIWEASISHRTCDNRGCPKCNFSKLEKAFEKAVKKLDIQYESQSRHDNCKHLPYDFHIPKDIDIELQGVQHFSEVPYFHRKKDSFQKGISRDCYKVLCTYEREYSFLSISYLCNKEGDIDEILAKFIKDKESVPSLYRFHITKDLFIDSISSPPSPPIEEDLLQVYNIYMLNLKCIQDGKAYNPKIEKCKVCNELHIKSLIHLHYRTVKHREMLKETHGNLFGVTENGKAIVFEDS